jgi:hypothetical protein
MLLSVKKRRGFSRASARQGAEELERKARSGREAARCAQKNLLFKTPV